MPVLSHIVGYDHPLDLKVSETKAPGETGAEKWLATKSEAAQGSSLRLI